MTPKGYGVAWYVTFGHSGSPGTDRVIDLLADTSLWPDLDVFTKGFVPGAPIGDREEIKRQIAAERDVYTFARGAPQSAMYIDESELAFRMAVRSKTLELQVQASGAELVQLGPRFLDDIIAMLATLHDEWRGDAQLLRAVAAPFSAEPLPGQPPPPVKRLPRHFYAIADVLSTELAAADEPAPYAAETRAILAGAVPEGVDRSERDGLVVIRWVGDPADVAAVAAGARRHAAWIEPLMPP